MCNYLDAESERGTTRDPPLVIQRNRLQNQPWTVHPVAANELSLDPRPGHAARPQVRGRQGQTRTPCCPTRPYTTAEGASRLAAPRSLELSYDGLYRSDSTLVMRLPKKRIVFVVDTIPGAAYPAAA